MYLVHVQLHPASPSDDLPADTGALVLAAAASGDAVEHVSVHASASPHPVVGLYLIADRLADAESRAAALFRRLTADGAPLHGWSPAGVGAPLVSAFYEQALTETGPAGRIRPGTFPSS